MSVGHRSVLVLGARLERLRGIRSALLRRMVVFPGPRRQLIDRVEALPTAEGAEPG